MEADEVYSELGDKITSLQEKDSEFQGTIDYLQSSITELKAAVEKAQETIQQLNEALSEIKSGASDTREDNSQKTGSLIDRMKAIEDANAASEKKAQEQYGIVGKLALQADDAVKTLANFPDTVKGIVGKAVSDGKQEVLNIWENGKKDLMNSLSDYTTKAIKDMKEGMWNDFKSYITETDYSKPKPVLEDDLEAKVRDVLSKVQSEKPSGEFEQKVRDIIAKVQSEKTS